MQPTENLRNGRLSTNPGASQSFLTQIAALGPAELRFDRNGPFWEGMQVARSLDLSGNGKKVAVVDADFDLNYGGLRAVVDPGSTVLTDRVGRRGRHGTAVALLVHEVAPAATLILLDVYPGIHLQSSAVADGIHAAVEAGANVINFSLEFSSDCPRADRSGFDLDVILSSDPSPEAFLDQVRYWLTASEPYRIGSCSDCAVCVALGFVPSEVVIVAASGNTDRSVCPACYTRSIGVGFEKRERVLVGDRDVITTSLPTFAQNLRTESLLPQPPGFDGTSFAAPLTSGLAAILPRTSDVASMSRMPFAFFPLAALLDTIAAASEPAERSIETLVAGFDLFGDACPDDHRHWSQASPGPCVTCSIYMIDWYNNYSALRLFIRDPGAVEFAALATTVAPFSPDAALNHGTALARAARSLPAGPSRRRGLREAEREYRRSLSLAAAPNAAVVELARVQEELGSADG